MLSKPFMLFTSFYFFILSDIIFLFTTCTLSDEWCKTSHTYFVCIVFLGRKWNGQKKWILCLYFHSNANSISSKSFVTSDNKTCSLISRKYILSIALFASIYIFLLCSDLMFTCLYLKIHLQCSGFIIYVLPGRALRCLYLS